MNVINQVEIKNYIEEVVLSRQRRPQYYRRKDILPKRYKKLLEKKELLWDTDTGYLCRPDGEKIISNPRSAGKARTIRINGQRSYSGMNFHLRSKLSRDLKEWFMKHMKFFKPVKEYPIGICLDFYGKDVDCDLDNKSYFYRKCCQDALVKMKIVEDDSLRYVRSIPCNYYESNEKKLIVTIFKL